MSGPRRPVPRACLTTSATGADIALEGSAFAPDGPEQAPAPAFLTAIEAAQLLRLTADTVRRQASAGLLPGVRLGRHWRFEHERLHAYLRGEWKPAKHPRRIDLAPSGKEAAEIFRQVRLRNAEKSKNRGR